ncbi:MAG: iron-containing alcohol dehydrogenase [Lentisphaeraceae bacterium]|nr:iron-containing alcohol dehydrogenase [Lentisphaeraceae bacterium]
MEILTAFQTAKIPKLIYGKGALNEVPEAIKSLGLSKVLIVTDEGIVKAGYPDRLKVLLQEAGYSCEIYGESKENPTEQDAENCAAFARDFEPEIIIGIGGGSSMDTAKACNFIYTNGGRMEDYMGYGKADKPMLPLICIPTTSGTGSECQSFALISRDSDHKKMACGDTKNTAYISVLDPELTVSQPFQVTANTGMDAITHAVETFVSKKANPFSRLYSAEAFRLLALAFPVVLQEPENIEARGAMLLGAAYAGLAIEHSMLGAAHGCANPISARFNTIHGQAVGAMLPAVIRKNSEDESVKEDYMDLLASVAGAESDHYESLADLIESFLEFADLPVKISEFGVTKDDIPELAEDAETQWTSTFNPVDYSYRDFAEVYGNAL